MAKFFQKSNPYFIACGVADASAQATFTDVYAQYSGANTEDATAAMTLDGNYNNCNLAIENTGAALTDFQMLGQVYRDGPWHTLITGTAWQTVANILKKVVTSSGNLNTLGSGERAIVYVDHGFLHAVKFQAKIANGVRNVGTFTASANPTNAKATGTFTATGQPSNTQTGTIGTTVYTFVTALTAPAVAFEVLIGATASDTLDNWIAAINASAGAGTTYGTGTTAHPSVTAAAGAGDTMDVTAIARGTAGNSIATTDTMSNGSWGAATLAGGTLETVTIGTTVYTFKHSDNLTTAYDVTIGANASDTCDNLIAAINASAGAGSLYYSATAHTQVTAAAGAGDTVVVTTKDGITNAVGTLIATTETCANCAWGATTLADAVMTSITVSGQFGKQM